MDDIKPSKPTTLPSVQPSSRTTNSLPIIDEPVSPQPSNKPRPRKKWLLIIGISLLVICAIGGASTWWWYNDALQPKGGADNRVRVVIKSGMVLTTIADELQTKGIIKSSLAFQVLVKQHGNRDKLQAGNYMFSPQQSPKEIMEKIVAGKVDTFNITILPGKTLADIKEGLIKDGFDSQEIDAAFAKQYEHPLLKDKPAGVSLEGYIFPETYQIHSDTSVESVLTRTFNEFYGRLEKAGTLQAFATRGLNIHQAATLASLVQLEVSGASDRRQVAQVFQLRLQKDMTLGSDVTFKYAARIMEVEPSINIDSPYNTRRYKGLPPGPVANFNFNAIEAVANPAPGEYLYFVSGDDGTNHFSYTEQEHEEKVRKYCSKLCFGN